MSLFELGLHAGTGEVHYGRRPNGFAEFLESRRGEWRCAFCVKAYSSEAQLMRHTKDVHVGRKNAVR